MGGPSHTSPYHEQPPPVVVLEPQPPQPFGDSSQPPPPQGYDNPIPTYQPLLEYNPFDPTTWPEHSHSHHVSHPDPYVEMVMNAHYPYPYQPCSYPYLGPQQPVAPPQQQPQPQPQPPQPSMEEIKETLEQMRELQEKTTKDAKKNRKLLKMLVLMSRSLYCIESR